MKEFIDKLIERLEEESSQALKDMIASKSNAGENFNSGMAGAFNKTIAIVNQFADEYEREHIVDLCNQFCDKADEILQKKNNGWIPCSERLPEEKEQERTVYDPITLAEVDIERYMASDLVNVTVRSWDSDEVFACDDCTVDGKWVNFNGEQYEVIAWMPLPAHYTEGE